MDGVSEWAGYPPDKRHRHVLYLMPDMHLKETAGGVGYPQTNWIWQPWRNYKSYQGWATPAQGYMVRDPIQDHVTWHEVGHATQNPMYLGEGKAINNFIICYIRHVKFGQPFNEAFAHALHVPTRSLPLS